MANALSSRDARIWYAVREQYLRMIDEVSDMYPPKGNATPDEIEGAELALSFARKDFWDLNAPTVDGVCERIVMLWGDRLDDPNDEQMWDWRIILNNLRLLSGQREDPAVSAKLREDG